MCVYIFIYIYLYLYLCIRMYINDLVIVIFTVKARLSILSTNCILHLWNRDQSPECPLCHSHTESVAHLLNSFNKFNNFYSRHRDRIVNKIAEFIK